MGSTMSRGEDDNRAVFEVDGAKHLQTAPHRADLGFQMCCHGNCNSVERIFRELRRETSSFPDCFSHVKPESAENRLQSFAGWHNTPN